MPQVWLEMIVQEFGKETRASLHRFISILIFDV